MKLIDKTKQCKLKTTNNIENMNHILKDMVAYIEETELSKHQGKTLEELIEQKLINPLYQRVLNLYNSIK